MVVAVPAQSQKPVPQLPSDRAANLTSESIPPGFHASHLHGSRVTYFCRPFVFIFLQIPSPATPLFSHPSECLGVLVRTCNPSATLCLGVSVANPLVSYCCGLFALSKKVKSFAIKQIQTLFAKHPGGGGSTQFHATHYPLLTTHFLSTQQPAWWKRVQECQCE
jgi:hypothetical protein